MTSKETSPPVRRILSEDEKRCADILLEQSKVAWNQFNARREYEFRVTLTVWSGFAAAVAGSLTFERFAGLFYGHAVLLSVALAIAAIHGYWCFGVYQAQAKDRAVALAFEHEVNALTGVMFDQRVKATLARGNKLPWLLQWTFFVQFSVTGLLALTLVAVNWQRVGVARAPTRSELEKQKLQLEIESTRRSLSRAE